MRTLIKNLLPPTAVDAIQVLRKSKVAIPVPTYNEDQITSRHNCEFLYEPEFDKAYKLAHATGSWGDLELRFRVRTAYDLAWNARNLPGDFVECGVNRGGLARAICHHLDFAKLPKTFYLLDTYNGLVPEQITPEERARGIDPGNYPECYQAVVDTFREYPNVKAIRGAVPGTLSQVPSARIAFLSIDMNCAAPEIAAAEYFWDKLSPGAPILLDDYSYVGHEGQMYAFNEFAAKRGLSVLRLGTCQGLIIKP